MAFLKERLDEDEAAAREAADNDSGQWFMGDKWNVYRTEDEARHDLDYQGEEHRLVVYGNVKPQSEHIALHDPARALHEVEAKRAILELHSGSHECPVYDHNGDIDNCGWIDEGDCPTKQHLAAVYSDHPGYRPEWKRAIA